MLCQYLRVWNILRGIVLEPLRVDRFIWSWNADGAYSASSAYRAFFAGSASLPGAKELWKTKAPARVKFFFWLAVHQRLWTADRRKNMACSLMILVPSAVKRLKLVTNF